MAIKIFLIFLIFEWARSVLEIQKKYRFLLLRDYSIKNFYFMVKIQFFWDFCFLNFFNDSDRLLHFSLPSPELILKVLSFLIKTSARWPLPFYYSCYYHSFPSTILVTKINIKGQTETNSWSSFTKQDIFSTTFQDW